MTPFFSAEPVRDFADAAACDLDAYGRFCRALLERGIYPPASQFEAWFVSLAHDEAAIDRTAEAASEAFAVALGVASRLGAVEPRPASWARRSLGGRRSELDVGAAVAAADQHQRQHQAECGDHRPAEERRLEALGEGVR